MTDVNPSSGRCHQSPFNTQQRGSPVAPALTGLLAARSLLWLSPSGHWPGAALLPRSQEGTLHGIAELSTICRSHGEAEQRAACHRRESGVKLTYFLDEVEDFPLQHQPLQRALLGSSIFPILLSFSRPGFSRGPLSGPETQRGS